MSQFPSNNPYGFNQPRPLDYAGSASEVVSVSRFFNSVYAWMSAGLALTAILAWVVSHNMEVMRTVANPVGLIVLVVALIALPLVIQNAIYKLSAAAATALFLLYSSIMGVALSGVFILYTQSDIATAFIATAGMFGVMSVFGMVTKTDLTGIGRLAMMALIGIIIASVVNFFIGSGMLALVISYVGVLVFTALTAYDTQKLKAIAIQTQGDAALSARMSVVGSLILYLDFVNLFMFLLRILGDRRR